MPAIVLLVAAVIRLWGLPSPAALYWDEQYYVYDAEVYLGGGIGQPIDDAPAVKIADEGTWIHPPLGKWIMALTGVGPLGLRSIGWRLPSAVFGVAGDALLYLLAQRLWRSVWWAGFVSLLLALDGLHIVQSRIAMLDIYMTTFVTAGMLFLVLDREQMDAGPRGRWPRTERVFGSPYRLSHPSARPWPRNGRGVRPRARRRALLGLGLHRSQAQSSLSRRDRWDARCLAPRRAAGCVSPEIWRVLLPARVAVQDFVTLQLRMLRYQQQHVQIQPENSLPWTWPLMLHPVQYFRETAGGSVRAIVALGNPALWWGFLILLPVGAVTLRRRATWRDALISGGYLAVYLPWLLVPRSQSSSTCFRRCPSHVCPWPGLSEALIDWRGLRQSASR